MKRSWWILAGKLGFLAEVALGLSLVPLPQSQLSDPFTYPHCWIETDPHRIPSVSCVENDGDLLKRIAHRKRFQLLERRVVEFVHFQGFAIATDAGHYASTTISQEPRIRALLNKLVRVPVDPSYEDLRTLYKVAQLMQEEDRSVRLVDIYTAQAKLLADQGKSEEAVAVMEAAKRLIGGLFVGVGDSGPLWHPPQGDDLISIAVRQHGTLRVPISARSLLSRAGVFGLTPRHLIAGKPVKISHEDLGLAYLNGIEAAYNEIILALWRHADYLGALGIVEQSRSLISGESTSINWRQLPPDDTLVEYALLPDRLLIWILGSNHLRVVQRKIRETALAAEVESFVKAIRQHDEVRAQRLSEKLYSLLIADVVADLPQGRVVYIVPDKSLNKLPFAVLRNPESHRFLTEDHPVALAPSVLQLQYAKYLRGQRKSRCLDSALIVGNPAFNRRLNPVLPNLSGADKEIMFARRVFKSVSELRREEARKRQVLSLLKECSTFIFAGHAVINSSRPSESCITLAPSNDSSDSGLLLGAEIQSMDLRNLDLVVLSACSSMGARSTRAAGVAGLAKPFLDAGAGSVVASLWEVSDRDGEQLWPSFYSALKEEQPIQALRQMQVQAIRSGVDMSSWAAFEVVIGNQPVPNRSIPPS